MSSTTTASSLAQLKGLRAAKRTVAGLFEKSSPVHAVLLFGEEGAGKSSLARALAQYWMCLQPTPEGACGECKICRSMERGHSSDLLEIRPKGLSSLITLPMIHPTKTEVEGEYVLSAQEFLRTLPVMARCKVVWVSDADRMNASAANAFLKTLEEPEPHARFVLTTTEVGKVLPTIRSRTMAVPCELPKPEEFGDEVEPWALVLSRRSPGMAVRLLEQAEAFEGIYRFAGSLRALPPEGALRAADEFKGLIEKLQKGEDSNARSAGAAALKALGTALASLEFSPDAIQRTAEAHRRILGNANASMELDALFTAILMRG